jgi:hypothetical protein
VDLLLFHLPPTPTAIPAAAALLLLGGGPGSLSGGGGGTSSVRTVVVADTINEAEMALEGALVVIGKAIGELVRTGVLVGTGEVVDKVVAGIAVVVARVVDLVVLGCVVVVERDELVLVVVAGKVMDVLLFGESGESGVSGVSGVSGLERLSSSSVPLTTMRNESAIDCPRRLPRLSVLLESGS